MSYTPYKPERIYVERAAQKYPATEKILNALNGIVQSLAPGPAKCTVDAGRAKVSLTRSNQLEVLKEEGLRLCEFTLAIPGPAFIEARICNFKLTDIQGLTGCQCDLSSTG